MLLKALEWSKLKAVIKQLNPEHLGNLILVNVIIYIESIKLQNIALNRNALNKKMNAQRKKIYHQCL